jgi:hypothetical protein
MTDYENLVYLGVDFIKVIFNPNLYSLDQTIETVADDVINPESWLALGCIETLKSLSRSHFDSNFVIFANVPKTCQDFVIEFIDSVDLWNRIGAKGSIVFCTNQKELLNEVHESKITHYISHDLEQLIQMTDVYSKFWYNSQKDTKSIDEAESWDIEVVSNWDQAKKQIN